MGSETCDYIGCENDGSLVERQHTGTGEVRQFCTDHDPLDDERASWQYTEADDGE